MGLHGNSILASVGGAGFNSKSFQFDGTGKIDFGANFRPAATDPWSLVLYVRPDAATLANTGLTFIYGNENDAGTNGFAVYFRGSATSYDGKPRISVFWAGTGVLVYDLMPPGITDFVADTWYMIGLTFNGGTNATSAAYINAVAGTLANRVDTLTVASYSANATLGVNTNPIFSPFTGYMTRPALFLGTELSQADMTAIYNSNAIQNIASYSGISHYYGADPPATTASIPDLVGAVNGTGTNMILSTVVPS